MKILGSFCHSIRNRDPSLLWLKYFLPVNIFFVIPDRHTRETARKKEAKLARQPVLLDEGRLEPLVQSCLLWILPTFPPVGHLHASCLRPPLWSRKSSSCEQQQSHRDIRQSTGQLGLLLPGAQTRCLSAVIGGGLANPQLQPRQRNLFLTQSTGE